MRPAAREHEDDLRLAGSGLASCNPARGFVPESPRQVVLFPGDDYAALGELAASMTQGEGRIRHGRHIVRGHKIPPFLLYAIERRRGAGREGKQPPAAFGNHLGTTRCFLDNGMGVRAANPEGIDSGPARNIPARPGPALVHHIEGAICDIEAIVWCLVVEGGRNDVMTQCLHHLDQARGPRRRIEMADVALDGTDPAKASAARAIYLRQARKFNRIAHRRTGAMSLYIADGFRRDIGNGEGFRRRFRLPIDTWCEIARLLRPIVIDGRANQHRLDIIPVGDCVFKAPEDNKGRAGAKHSPLTIIVEGPADPVR